MISIALADDHPLLREGLKKVLAKENDMEVVCEAENAEQMIEFVRNQEVQVAILDINLPGMSGLDALKILHTSSPNLRVLILSMYPEDRFAVRALKNGADGYMTKSSAAEELIHAIRSILSGRRYLSSTATELLVRELSKPADRLSHEILSEREMQIMLMLVRGKTVKEISKELNLSVNTVNTYRARILNKMNLRNTNELVRYAYDNRLIE
ncbi:DNA-binding response regulator [Leptospira perolatii]|uniref:DNA-binding response regulator n=1 Tax=Leptospira perolatii TaxID=2023191 RepID=A0A2M9ZI02_9LEPT|nr:response regulator transcription factor [Leptospira perolatii]PJZ69490.1 DNA-binding response regulator [Leptospira perolatii]PJZ71662.1 DNA-binding response regulator [Leptospira perolatii]